MTKVTGIAIYPIKSCGGISLTSANVGRTGLVGDRMWQVSVDDAPLTQRQCPALATVQPTPVPGGLQLSAPGHPTIEVAAPSWLDSETKSLTGTPVAVADAGDEAASWFTSVTGSRCRLHHLTNESDLRPPSAIDVFDQPMSFADLAPIHIVNAASYKFLADRSSEPFTIDRFRSNIVIDGLEPWVEDSLRTFAIGAAAFQSLLPWPRCAMPQVHQTTGDRMREPAKILREHRWCDSAPALEGPIRSFVEGSALFGIGCSATPHGSSVSVGDDLDISECAAPILAPPRHA